MSGTYQHKQLYTELKENNFNIYMNRYNNYILHIIFTILDYIIEIMSYILRLLFVGLCLIIISYLFGGLVDFFVDANKFIMWAISWVEFIIYERI